MFKYLNLFLLVIFFNKIISMQLSLVDMPNEILLNINKQIIKSYINNWKNIFKFSKDVNKDKLLVDLYSLRVSCQKLNAIFDKNFFIKEFKKLKKKRFEKLKNDIIFKYNLPELEINLKNLLNKDVISKKDIKKWLSFIFCGADANLKNKHGDTILFYAIEKNLLDIIDIILDLNISLDIQNKDGNTALMLASKLGNNKLVKALLNYKVNLNIKNKYMFTALVFAIINNKQEVIDLLIDKGACLSDMLSFIALVSNSSYLNLIKIITKSVCLNL